MDKTIQISGHEVNVHKDNTVRREKYYCVLGVSKRKVIYGGSVDIVYRKCLRSYAKHEISFEAYEVIDKKVEVKDVDSLPF